MTTPTIALAELAEKGSDIDVLRQMVQFMAQRLMDMDIEGRCGAGYDEKNTERLNSRNGYRERTWDTRAGSVPLKISKLRPRVRHQMTQVIDSYRARFKLATTRGSTGRLGSVF